MDKEQIFRFISKQKTAFIASVNEQGCPVIRAMLAPRKIDGNEIYFSTTTPPNKAKHTIIGEMQVCTDQETKDGMWRLGDRLFYKQGVTDPDYCVLKFTGKTAEYYCDFKIETIEL